MPLVKTTIAEAHEYYHVNTLQLPTPSDVGCPNCHYQRELNMSDTLVIETGTPLGKPSVILYKCPRCGENVIVLYLFLCIHDMAELQIAKVIPFISNKSWEILAGKREIYGTNHSAKYKVAYANHVIQTINECTEELNVSKSSLVKRVLEVAYSLSTRYSHSLATTTRLHALFEKFKAEKLPFLCTKVERSLYDYAIFSGASTLLISNYNDEINEIFKGL